MNEWTSSGRWEELTSREQIVVLHVPTIPGIEVTQEFTLLGQQE
jgi:hypothetical protein